MGFLTGPFSEAPKPYQHEKLLRALTGHTDDEERYYAALGRFIIDGVIANH